MSNAEYTPLEKKELHYYERDNRVFIPLFVVALILGAAAVVCTASLMGLNGGFAWTKELIFNFHPFFMVLGLVFLYGEAILIYRSLTYISKYPIKIIHGLLQLTAFVLAVIALVAVFNSHNWKGFKNLYSFHSWLGITTVSLFGLQWLIALLIYMLPFASSDLRKWMMPIHRGMGLAIFVMAIGTVILGVTEQNLFTNKYPELGTKVVLGNMIAVFAVLFLAVVVYMVTKEEWRRPPDEVLIEEKVLLRK